MGDGVSVWIHSRKGRIVGEKIREDDTWMWVRLIGDHNLYYYAQANWGREDRHGEIICVRKGFMRAVADA